MTMAEVMISASGVVLGEVQATSTTKGATHGLQAMRIAFSDSLVLEEVLKHGADLKISFGKSMRLVYGDKFMEVVAAGETHRHEIYQQLNDGRAKLGFIGTLSHNLEVRKLHEDSPDESLLKLRKGYELLNDQKAASTPMVVDSSELSGIGGRRNRPPRNPPYLRKKLPLGQSHSGPGTPSLKSSRSPLPDLVDATVSKEIQAKLDALRVPLIHLLALGPASEHGLSSKTKASEDLCIRVLQRVAHKTVGGRQWELMDDVYKDLDIWDFPYSTSNDRSKAAQNCREAFVKLKLDKSAPSWRSILPPEDREKVDGILDLLPSIKPPLSRINSTPATENIQSIQASTDTKLSTEESFKTNTQPVIKSSKSIPKDPISRIIGGRKKKVNIPAKTRGPVGRPPKNPINAKISKSSSRNMNPTSGSKIKSAEIIYDSDEDVELEDLKTKQIEKFSPSTSQKINKAISKVSSTTESDIEADVLRPHKKLPSSTPSKPKIKKVRSSVPSSNIKSPINSTSHHNDEKKPIKDSMGGRGSSNSPPKPSPLGCSPPINASDADDVSTSSSPSFLTSNAGSSTASHSPIDSTTKANKPRYIPTTVTNLKRKASEDSISARSRNKSANSLNDNLILQIEQSVPDAPIIKLARRFKEDYARYERLYKEVQLTTDTQKKKEKIERVISMHQSLEALKQKISLGVIQ